MERQPVRDLLGRSCFRRALRPDHVTGDATYGPTGSNVVAIEDAAVRVNLPIGTFTRQAIQRLEPRS